MLERLRQVVGREKNRRDGMRAASAVDKTCEGYVEKLQQRRENRAAVRNGSANAEQARTVRLDHKTNQEYNDLVAYCRVNEKLDEERYRMFIPDMYKTGWKASQH
jgi:hypothetical protein